MEHKIVKYPCNILLNYPNIIKRIKELNESCFNLKTDCCINSNCTNNVYFYIKYDYMDMDIDYTTTVDIDMDVDMDVDVDYKLEMLSKKPYVIKSLLLEKYSLAGSEIYNVCTDILNRNKGYMRILLLEYLKMNSKNKITWLGIDTRQSVETITKLYKLYTVIGFYNPVLVKNTGIFLNTLPFYVIGLTHTDKPHTRYNPNTFDIILNTLNFKETTENKFLITLKTCLQLQDYLKYPFEAGGTFLKRKNVLEINHNSITYSTIESCKVDISAGFFNFHTHPHHCYNKYQCNYGWLSIMDISYILQHFATVGLHYVVSLEGIYSVQLTPEFRTFLNTNTLDTLKFLQETIVKVFLKNEECLRQQDSSIVYTKFLSVICSYTLYELTEQNSNFFLFKAVLYTWDYIYENNGFIDSFWH